jgi:hypothetical protein
MECAEALNSSRTLKITDTALNTTNVCNVLEQCRFLFMNFDTGSPQQRETSQHTLVLVDIRLLHY